MEYRSKTLISGGKNHFLIFAITLFVLGCNDGPFDCVKKAGSTKTVTIPAQPFYGINMYDGLNVILQEGIEQEIKVSAGENLIDKLNFSVDGDGFLNISNKNTCNWVREYKDINVYITTDTLKGINQYGYGNLRTEGIITFKDITINAKDGVGDVNLVVDNLRLYIVSNSISNFYLTGQTENLVIGFYYNDGIFRGKNFRAKKVNITHLGTNTIEIFASESLKGTLQDKGDILYHGDPESVDVAISGEGDLLKQ